MPLYLPPLSRRQFLARSLAAGTGLLLSQRLLAAARDADPHMWALISDPHIAADRAKLGRNINMAAQLTAVVDDVLSVPRRPAGALVNGDLAFNTGETADYATFAELIQPLRAAQIPLHLGLGNHDHRERFWAALREDASVKRPLADRQAAVIRTERANWFLLDSLDKPNSVPGRLGEAQLAWLTRALDANADKPALVMVHHNPRVAADKITLIDEDAFYAIIRPRRQVKAYLFGHSHRWNVGKDPSGIHLINLPTTAYVFEAGRPAGWVLAQLEPRGLNLQFRGLDPKRAEHLQAVALTYRT
ncbi:MAG: phosphohydrolase [Opitutus sp.]|nr:phosphohydrolase [Opitutus sp.]